MWVRMPMPGSARAVMKPSDEGIAAVLTDLALRRGRGKTFCPSEAAKALSPDWRPLMPEVRRVAAGHPDVVATQRGVPVDPVTARGPIRLGLR
jgi:hypothetical protein